MELRRWPGLCWVLIILLCIAWNPAVALKGKSGGFWGVGRAPTADADANNGNKEDASSNDAAKGKKKRSRTKKKPEEEEKVDVTKPSNNSVPVKNEEEQRQRRQPKPKKQQHQQDPLSTDKKRTKKKRKVEDAKPDESEQATVNGNHLPTLPKKQNDKTESQSTRKKRTRKKKKKKKVTFQTDTAETTEPVLEVATETQAIPEADKKMEEEEQVPPTQQKRSGKRVRKKKGKRKDAAALSDNKAENVKAAGDAEEDSVLKDGASAFEEETQQQTEDDAETCEEPQPAPIGAETDLSTMEQEPNEGGETNDSVGLDKETAKDQLLNEAVDLRSEDAETLGVSVEEEAAETTAGDDVSNEASVSIEIDDTETPELGKDATAATVIETETAGLDENESGDTEQEFDAAKAETVTKVDMAVEEYEKAVASDTPVANEGVGGAENAQNVTTPGEHLDTPQAEEADHGVHGTLSETSQPEEQAQDTDQAEDGGTEDRLDEDDESSTPISNSSIPDEETPTAESSEEKKSEKSSSEKVPAASEAAAKKKKKRVKVKKTKKVDLTTCQDESTDMHISVVTWNLAEESPEEEDATFLRRFRKFGVDQRGSDFVLISGQECENIKPRRTEGRRSREYRRLMIKMLGKNYIPIAMHQLGGIQFGLFCKRSILEDLEHVSVADVTCGIGNVFHNKGAIGAFVQVKARNDHAGPDERRSKSLKMLFVTAHMAAHVKHTDARDSDFWRIVTELEAQAPPKFLPHHGEDSGGRVLLDTVDRIFFCGDLNYRVDLPREVVEHTVQEMARLEQQGGRKEKIDQLRSSLLLHDQLSATIADRRAFLSFGEGKIGFPPTFKFDKETDDYDTSHKQRIPAWTDRVLFKPFGTRVLEYDSVRTARHSDHRPVHATFRINARGRTRPPPLKSKTVQRRKRKSTRPRSTK